MKYRFCAPQQLLRCFAMAARDRFAAPAKRVSDLKVNSAPAPLRQRLQRRAPQDLIDAIADLAPDVAHRTGVAALAWRVAALFQAFDRREVPLDNLHDV